MTTDTDKLVEMALECGASRECLYGEVGLMFSPDKLAAFRDRIIASLCGDVEPDVYLRWEGDGQFGDYVVTNPGQGRPFIAASTVAALKAERDAALARATDWQRLYDRAINEANGLTNYVEDRPELRSAERRLDVIAADARALKGQP